MTIQMKAIVALFILIHKLFMVVLILVLNDTLVWAHANKGY